MEFMTPSHPTLSIAKNMVKGEGTYLTRKPLLGFDFDGQEKTMWLESAKHKKNTHSPKKAHPK